MIELLNRFSACLAQHCYRSHNQKWVVVADDAGLVRLNNYPAVVRHTPGYAHKGHA